MPPAERERILSLDDDIASWDRSLSFRHRGSTLQEFIEYAFDYAVQNRSFIWGVYPVFNPFFRDLRPEFIFCNCFLVGAFYGFINRKSMEMTLSIPNLEEKDDVYRSIQYFDRDGVVVRFDRIGFETKYYNSVGGLGNFETRKNKSEALVKTFARMFPHAGGIKIRKNGVWEFRFYPKAPCLAERKVEVIGEFDKSVFEPLRGMLDSYSFVRFKAGNRKNFPAHEYEVFGFILPKFQRGERKLVLSKATEKRPDIALELKRVASLVCPADFKYNSIHINKNLTCPRHIDGRNMGKSVLVSFGDYTGSDIVVICDAEEVRYSTNCRSVLFNGSCLEHYNSDDLIGSKYSLVFYFKKNK